MLQGNPHCFLEKDFKKPQVEGQVQAAAVKELQYFPRLPRGTVQLYLTLFDSFNSFNHLEEG